jgi:hypothetical protein
VKTCKLCGETKSLDQFYDKRRKNGSTGKEARCKVCVSKTKAARHDPEKHRAKWLRQKFDLTIEEYETMLKNQEGRCAICLSDTFNFSHGKRAHVDHCHDTGKVRGLLCGRCNVALGHFKHDPEIIQKAINYLQKHA